MEINENFGFTANKLISVHKGKQLVAIYTSLEQEVLIILTSLQ